MTHKFELHFVVALLECEYKEYEDRHVHHEGNEAVVAVQEQEELLGGEEGGEGQGRWKGVDRGRREGRGRAGGRVWRGQLGAEKMQQPYSKSSHTRCLPNKLTELAIKSGKYVAKFST